MSTVPTAFWGDDEMVLPLIGCLQNQVLMRLGMLTLALMFEKSNNMPIWGKVWKSGRRQKIEDIPQNCCYFQ